jgi:predicted DNA-binding antitoxin AbrB/MazE fold protein
MIVKARYENNVLKPLGKLDLKEGEEVDIRVKESATKMLFGTAKCWEGLVRVHEDYEIRIH